MKPKILTVEDEADFAQLLEYNLSRRDFEVFKIASGLEALHVARQIQPDVILLDLMLPDMNGAWVLDILRSQPSTKDIPIIVVSAVDEVFLRRQTKGKVAYYFQKPVDMNALAECVRSLIELRQKIGELEEPENPRKAPQRRAFSHAATKLSEDQVATAKNTPLG